MNISHKEFVTILNEKDRTESMKENIKNKNEGNKQRIIKLSSIKQTLEKKFFFFLPIYKNVRNNNKELL